PAAPETTIRKQISSRGEAQNLSPILPENGTFGADRPKRSIMPQLSSAEIVAFVALFAASLYAFWRRFGPVVDIIRRSKPDGDFTLQPIAPRVRKFVWEVLLQGKVIRERPLPGIAHAFVFWGFCAFALITIAHFAAGIGLNLL